VRLRVYERMNGNVGACSGLCSAVWCVCPVCVTLYSTVQYRSTGVCVPLLLLLLLLIRSTTSLCIYGLLYHLLYVYLYDRWFPEPRG
jgi:hypothetical protein